MMNIATIPTSFGELRVSIVPVGVEQRLILSEVYKQTVPDRREDAGSSLVVEFSELKPLIDALIFAQYQMCPV